MNTSLKHLPAEKRAQLQAITNIIVRSVNPEKVILFGMYDASHAGVEVPDDSGLSSLLNGYDLLVIARRGDRRYEHELQDVIESRCRVEAPVTIWVHDIDHVNKQLSEGHYFFSFMLRDGLLLYDAGIVPLAEGVPPDLTAIRMTAQKDFQRWHSQAMAFFKSALFNRQQQETRLVIFMLHQAAEHIYQGILLVFMGYKPCTHNLDKLRRYTNRFSIELAMLFPRNSPSEENLFRLLLHSYVDARYKEDYRVTEMELATLTDRVSRLLSVAERVCRNRFLSLEKMAAYGGVV